MKTNSSASQTLFPGLGVHKAETVIAILDSDRDAGPKHYGSIATTQHALERVMRRIIKNQICELSDLPSVKNGMAKSKVWQGGMKLSRSKRTSTPMLDR